MNEAEIKQKLQDQSNRGSMARIAYAETIKDHCESQTRSLLSTLIHYYREGKAAQEMMGIIGELSAIEKLDSGTRTKIHLGEKANKALEDHQNAEADRERHKDYG